MKVTEDRDEGGMGWLWRKPRKEAIRQLNARHRARIIKHLLTLPAQDRYLRFGYTASDEQIQRYAQGLNFDQDSIFGVYNWRLQLLAVAHVAYSVDSHFSACAEFGVSVLPSARGRGLGGLLFDRAVIHARNEGVSMMFVHALSENTAMIRIARRAGAEIELDAGEAQAYLRLPPATFDSRVSELIEEQLAQTDYKLKLQARQFLSFLAELQSVRRGVQEGRHKSGA